MTNPVTFSAALVIAKLACGKFFESSVGKLGEKFTEAALKKIDELYRIIREKLSVNRNTASTLTAIEQGKEEELQGLAVYLRDTMNADQEFADQVQVLAREIHAGKIQDNSQMLMNIDGTNNTGNQTKNDVTNQGGTNYIGVNTINNSYYQQP
ncbi:MAG: hypothetical protein KME46_10635 [Brasilonema angustatum HA4187-MV1]|jgi:hypothetical protein|nr:hypothetical protein [Brasilonema angustatum HA4187-MV1]